MSLKLTDQQKNRLQRLEPQLKRAISEQNLDAAKFIMRDIQDVLEITNNKTRLAQYKNWLYELALETGDYNFAERGFIGNRKIVNKNTRIYLEASALLAICYLRTEKYEEAKPLIQEVLKNDKVIKSDRTRHLFKKNIIERFDEEVALYSLKDKTGNPNFDIDELEREAVVLIQTKTEDEIFESLGKQTPQYTKHLIFEIDSFSKKQLSYTERKLLPSSAKTIKDKEAGKTVFSSFKRVIYNSICDPKSEVYKAWFTNGMGAVLDKKYLITAVVGSLAQMSICIKGLIVSAIALVIRFGLDVYCVHYQPKGVMEIRKE
ncbi:tetratricopeptide repeat protein [Flavobacterium inviolabile]|uniref:tetratricopeptide repeat protein n=1 Tax=Flavobacterium inviolabile TaxID=2748320 RepID=UPI0015AFEC57|nr:hypothetical protein [Flavobacterium inviolabile]